MFRGLLCRSKAVTPTSVLMSADNDEIFCAGGTLLSVSAALFFATNRTESIMLRHNLYTLYLSGPACDLNLDHINEIVITIHGW